VPGVGAADGDRVEEEAEREEGRRYAAFVLRVVEPGAGERIQ